MIEIYKISGINDLQEKLYDFEQNKKNNLIFYGIANDTRLDIHLVEKLLYKSVL